MAAHPYNFVIVGGGSAGSALANRLSADPGARVLVLEGRPPGLHLGPVHPHARRAHHPDRQPLLRLEVRERAGAAHERAAHLPRPRQGPRRVEQHQRDDLPARQPAGLRALGGRRRHGRLGLRALPAVLQADGELPGRGREGPVPRAHRAAGARAGPGHQPAVRRVLRRRAAGRLPAHRRRERLPAGGLRPVRPERPPRPAAVRRAGLPVSGDEPAEPHRGHPGLRHQDHLRRHPRGRRRVPARGQDQAGQVRASSSCAAGRSTPRSCSSCPASATPRSSPRSASTWSPTCPAWARTCRTTWRCTSSTARSCRSRSRPR